MAMAMVMDHHHPQRDMEACMVEVGCTRRWYHRMVRREEGGNILSIMHRL